jgi:hypothetical protein
MSKQAKKRVRVKPKHIKNGAWYYKGVFQKQLSQSELDKINRLTQQDKYVSMRIINQLRR